MSTHGLDEKEYERVMNLPLEEYMTSRYRLMSDAAKSTLKIGVDDTATAALENVWLRQYYLYHMHKQRGEQ